jgi:hypothetical protein
MLSFVYFVLLDLSNESGYTLKNVLYVGVRQNNLCVFVANLGFDLQFDSFGS